jgi:hypothetical protein
MLTDYSAMDWLNLHTSTLDAAEFIGSDPVERATWLCLLRYCLGQENGGVIKNCAQWKDRRWQQLVRVTKEEILSNCDLWQWLDDDLVVWRYPADKERQVKANRDNGKKGGRPRKIKTQTKPCGYDSVNPNETTWVDFAETEGEGEGEGEIEEEQERKRKTRARFQKPTLEEITEYCSEKGYTFDPERFLAYYESNGWRVGRNPMKSWKAACTNWQKNEGMPNKGGNGKPKPRTETHSTSRLDEFGWHPEDYAEYAEHEQWVDYTIACGEEFGWSGEHGQWPRFEAWRSGTVK